MSKTDKVRSEVAREGVRARAAERSKGEAWFNELPLHYKILLGDDMVLDGVDWFDWFDSVPSPSFKSGVAYAWQLWEESQ